MKKQKVPQDDRNKDPVQRQQRNNLWITVRVIAVLYLIYLIYQMIQGYRQGETDMSFPTVAVLVAVFIASVVLIVVLSIRRWRRERARIQKMWDELAEEEEESQ